MVAEKCSTIAVMCVDDNKHVADALKATLSRTAGFEWTGWLASAADLVAHTTARCPQIVLLDLDMPGPDPLAALVELCRQCPESRVIIFSGHVGKDLFDRGIGAGAWGYVAKADGHQALLTAIRQVAAGEFAVSPSIRAAMND
jgi:DNA-binding NarL/FixJ family response regulator